VKSVDVIVVGGGVAGATATYHLAKLGNSVLMFDKRHLNPHKSCGGGMASSVQKWFTFDLLPVVDEVIKRVEFTWKLEDKTVANLPGTSPFWIVRRENLDALITNEAIKKGAEIINPISIVDIQKFNNLWIVKDEQNREYSSKGLIIANGSNSIWSNKLGIGAKKPHYAYTTSVRLQGRGNVSDGVSRFEFGLVHHGFAWAFPIKEGVNIGIGTFIGNNKTDTSAILKKLLPDLGFSPNEGTRIEGKLSVWNGHHKLNGDGVVAIGDAASLCDPFLAEGIRPAIMSGFESAKAINFWLKGETKNLDNFTATMQKQWGDSMAWGRRISQVFYRFPKVGYQLGIKRPTAPERIAQILSGEMGYGDIANRVIKRLVLQK